MPDECPVCGDEPQVTEFAVNPMFGGGVAYECRCPMCGFGDGMQYRTREAALAGWNGFVREDLYGEDLEEEDG